MSEVEFITIVLALGLGISIAYGLSHLIAWLIVNHQIRMEILRWEMSYSSYQRMRRRKRRDLIIFVLSIIFTSIAIGVYYVYYWNFGLKTGY